MQTRITVGCGIEFDKNGKAIEDAYRHFAKRTIRHEFVRLCGGVTFHETEGAWKNPLDGKVVIEKGWTIVGLTLNNPKPIAEWLAKFVKESLKQDTVVLIVEKVHATFI